MLASFLVNDARLSIGIDARRFRAGRAHDGTDPLRAGAKARGVPLR